MEGHLEVARLLEARAYRDKLNETGLTPLELALDTGNTELIELLGVDQTVLPRMVVYA